MTGLPPHKDAFGRMLLDTYEGTGRAGALERDDGWLMMSLPDVFFDPEESWDPYERRAMKLVHGRVLDIGCGAGRHALHFQQAGHEVTGIDISPGAVEVCRRRGVKDVRLLPLTRVSRALGTFDSVLMLYGNFNLFQSVDRARRLLARLHSMTAAAGRIFADSVASNLDDPDHARYFAANRAKDRYPGHIRARFRYRALATPWSDLLNVSPGEMREVISGTGWHIGQVFDDGDRDYLAVLAKD